MHNNTPKSWNLVPREDGNKYSVDNNKSGGDYSGGTSALNWELSSLTSGGVLTVRTDGTYDFGTKDQAAPVLWDMVSELFENGVQQTPVGLADDALVTSGDAYLVNDFVRFTSSRSPRVANRPFHYYADCSPIDGSVKAPMLNKPRAFDADTQRPSLVSECYAARRFKVSTIFNPETNDRLFYPAWVESTAVTAGEIISFKGLNNGQAQSGLGSDLCFEAQNSGTTGSVEPAWPDENTATIGVTTFVDNDITWLVVGRSSSSTKFVRVWDNPAGAGTTRISWTHDQLTGPFTTQGVDTIFNDADWHLLEIYVSNRTGIVTTYIDNQIVNQATDFVQLDTNFGLYPTNFGFEQNGSGPCNIVVDWGEIYGDRSSQRIMLGNAATWATCTEWAYQRATAWSANEVTVISNDDSISLGAGNWYLYVLDQDNAPVTSNGVLI